jgi:cytochrome c biogenesis protein CcmG/thiol:disulfide interchange protein DsbE
MIPAMDRSLIGRTAPEIEGQRLEGAAPFRLSELRGKPVIVAFWASWCSPCRYELPALSAFMRGRRDVEAIAVNVDRTREEALAFLARTPLELPVVLDSQAVSLGRYGVSSMPTTFLVDSHGTVKWKRVGFNREHGIQELAEALEAIR